MQTRMRTSLLVLASVLLLLATRAHGIRLDRQLNEALNSKKEMDGLKARQSFSTPPSMNKHCTSDGHCSGKVKRPLAHETPAAAWSTQQHQSMKRSHDGSTVEANRGGGKDQQEAAGAVVVHGVARQPQAKTSTYPDILDIAGMDYSPATRKPPIHN